MIPTKDLKDLLKKKLEEPESIENLEDCIMLVNSLILIRQANRDLEEAMGIIDKIEL